MPHFVDRRQLVSLINAHYFQRKPNQDQRDPNRVWLNPDRDRGKPNRVWVKPDRDRRDPDRFCADPDRDRREPDRDRRDPDWDRADPGRFCADPGRVRSEKSGRLLWERRRVNAGAADGLSSCGEFQAA